MSGCLWFEWSSVKHEWSLMIIWVVSKESEWSLMIRSGLHSSMIILGLIWLGVFSH